MRIQARFGFLSVLVAVLAFASIPAAGQTGVFNIPSTDTVGKRRLYVEADVFTKPDRYSRGGFQEYGPSVVYGVTDRFEIGSNLYFIRDEEGWTTEWQPNAKLNFYASEKAGVEASVGTVLFVPVSSPSGSRSSGMFYANASKSFGKDSETRFTGGVYGVVTGDDEFGDKAGVMIGFDRMLTKRTYVMADWMSGNNRLGYATVAFGVDVRKNQNFEIGYSFGNTGRGNNYLSVLYGFTF
jgi:hypothetical protein